MKAMLILALFCFLGLLAPTSGLADCVCQCVNGQVVPLCDSTLDIKPICAPRICPITPPSVEPINPPVIPPIGTKTCSMEQVYNEWTGTYEWKQVCY